MTSARPAEPIDAADAAQSLADAGLARDYEQARADIEAARAAVSADLVGVRSTSEPIGWPR